MNVNNIIVWINQAPRHSAAVVVVMAAVFAYVVVALLGPDWADASPELTPVPLPTSVEALTRAPISTAAPTTTVAPATVPATPAAISAGQSFEISAADMVLRARLEALEQRQYAVADRLIESRSKTLDWWLAYLAVFTAALGLVGLLIPFLMARRDRQLFEVTMAAIEKDQKAIQQSKLVIERNRAAIEKDLVAVRQMKGETKEHLEETRKYKEAARFLAEQRPGAAGSQPAPDSEKVHQAVETINASNEASRIDRLRAEALSVPEDQPEIAYALWSRLLTLRANDGQAAFYCGYYAQTVSNLEDRTDQSLWRKRAIEHYAKAVELDPRGHSALNNWGNALDEEACVVALDDLPAARVLWQQARQRHADALRIEPNKYEAAYNWGNVLAHEAAALATSDLPAARVLWQRAGQRYADALRIKPDAHEAANNWGTALSKEARAVASSDLPAARALWQQAGQRFADVLRIRPDTFGAAYNWGDALAAEAGAVAPGDFPAARVLWQQAGQHYADALRIEPDKGKAANRWANALLGEAAATEDAEGARRLAERARELLLPRAPKSPEVYAYNLACAYARLGEFTDSLIWLRQAQVAGSLPSKSHVESDQDLTELRKQPEFGEWLREAFPD